MILDRRRKLIEDWKDGGISHIEESIWSSTVQQKDLNKIREFLFKNNLKLTVGLENELKNQECQDKTLYIINSLRVIFGVPIARELMFKSSGSIENFLDAGVNSELGYASKFDTQDLNLYEEIEYCQLRELPVEALILLDNLNPA